jgi:2-polyprenyl-3-methyl-5-hydroxy-6-metoxy-1,4-benzoquinol methylase
MIYKNKKELLQRTVKAGDAVLDVGFWGQGIQEDNPKWPHAILKKISSDVYGIDLALPEKYKSDPHYREMSAEDFSFPDKFDVIFAGDLIEHLSNPGLFLLCCKRQLKPGGKLVLTTPSAFNLFNLAEKITKREPSVNPDHTVYFNSNTLEKLLQKNGMHATEVGSLYSLEYEHRESLKKRFLNAVYKLLSLGTDKFIETLVVIAVPDPV